MKDNYLDIPWNFERKNQETRKNSLEGKLEDGLISGKQKYNLPEKLQREKLPFLARFIAGVSLLTLGLNITIYHFPLTKRYFTEEIRFVQNCENEESAEALKFKEFNYGESANIRANINNAKNAKKTSLTAQSIYEETKKRISSTEYILEKESSYKLVENRIKNFSADSRFTIDDKITSNNAIRDAYKKLIKYYFNEYNAELLGLEGFFVNYCFEKKLDPAFVFSIIYNESTVGTQGWGYYNKNPGNLRGYGTLGERGGYAYFRTWKDGIKALIDLLSEKYSNLSVRKAVYTYAPPSENDTIKLTNDIVNVTKKALRRVYNYLTTGSVVLEEDNQNR
ncbi:MAG: hypothetical protein ACP5H9_01945 [Candidatus Woesearchaeota archaeon]